MIILVELREKAKPHDVNAFGERHAPGLVVRPVQCARGTSMSTTRRSSWDSDS